MESVVTSRSPIELKKSLVLLFKVFSIFRWAHNKWEFIVKVIWQQMNSKIY